jgi:hypothetical protein
VDTRHLSEWLERSANLAFGGLKAHIPYEQILHIILSQNPVSAPSLCTGNSKLIMDRDVST